MDYSFVVIDKQNKLNLTQFISYIKSYTNNYEIIYCSSKKNNRKTVRNFVVDINENTEKILNSIVHKCQKSSIVIIRDINSYKNVGKLIENHKSNNQILFFKKQSGKFKSYLFKLYFAVISKFFGHNLINADYSAVLYGEIPSKVLKNILAPAVLLRSNRWEGLELNSVGESNSSYCFGYKKAKLAISTIVPAVVFITMLILDIVLKFNFAPIIAIMYYMVIILSILLSCIFGARWILNSHMGEAVLEKANIIKGENENGKN